MFCVGAFVIGPSQMWSLFSYSRSIALQVHRENTFEYLMHTSTSLPRNLTYNLKSFSASEMLDNHQSILTSFGIEPSADELDSKYIYCIPKMYKNQYKHRLISGLSKCSPILYPFSPQKCLLILSKAFKSTAKQLTQKLG